MVTVKDPPRITLGNKARIALEIDVAEVPTDPTELFLYVRGEHETLGPFEYGVGATIVRDSAGRFHADVIPTRTGRFAWRYDARGAASEPLAATEGEFHCVSILEAR